MAGFSVLSLCLPSLWGIFINADPGNALATTHWTVSEMKGTSPGSGFPGSTDREKGRREEVKWGWRGEKSAYPILISPSGPYSRYWDLKPNRPQLLFKAYPGLFPGSILPRVDFTPECTPLGLSVDQRVAVEGLEVLMDGV